jgi:HD-GYP domain-containing protein (c-di-GMP phosphodiesterase class II)
LFLAVAVVLVLYLPDERGTHPLVVPALLAGYILAQRVRFEFGGSFGTAEQLVIMPLLLLAPLPFVPFLIVAASLLASIPEIVRGDWHRERLVGTLADSWFCLPPVFVLATLAPGEASLDHASVYVLAFGAQLAGDAVWTFLRDRLLDHNPIQEVAASWYGTARVDAVLAPIGVLVAVPAVDHPLALLALVPLAWLLHSFSRDRTERYAKTLELNRAYRGVVMLLSDVVETDDAYTADHSKSVVELVNAVADQLNLPLDSRQELEFAAMLHDVGKISIPSKVLNKPSGLTDDEFELIKTHTIEGQFMLDRVGGLLGRVGEIVRSCHERWDGRGYPDGLAGDEIPLAARIVFACDAYHAITSDRVYRPARSKEAGLAELAANAGTQFDLTVVDALVKVIEDGEPLVAASDGVRAVLATVPVARDAHARATT